MRAVILLRAIQCCNICLPAHYNNQSPAHHQRCEEFAICAQQWFFSAQVIQLITGRTPGVRSSTLCTFYASEFTWKVGRASKMTTFEMLHDGITFKATYLPGTI